MRTREIKPSFYRNEQLTECSAFARLIFPGLWMLADREGRFEYRPKRIKAELLPYDSVDMDALMGELEANDLIRRYEVDGKKYCWIPTFTLHQRVHPKEAQSTIPPHPDEKPHLGDTQTTPRCVQDNTQVEPEQHLGDVEPRSYFSLSSLSSLSGNLKTHPLPLASEGNGDAVSNSPHGSRQDGTNPRALGSNPRAQGTNPRAQDENPRAQGNNPRATCSQVSKTESAAQIEAYTKSPELRESLKAFVESRRALRKPLTAHALGLAFSQLDKLASDDATKIAVVDQSVLNGWQGFFPIRDNNARASPSVSQTPRGQGMTLTEKNMAVARQVLAKREAERNAAAAI